MVARNGAKMTAFESSVCNTYINSQYEYFPPNIAYDIVQWYAHNYAREPPVLISL